MATLHDTHARGGIVARIRSVRPDSIRQWGTMSPDRMLWHVNQGLLVAVGRLPMAKIPAPLPGFLLKPLVLNLPWPKGAPTAPEFVAREDHDFAAEQQQCLQLVAELAGLPLTGEWPRHGAFGPMTGPQWSRLEHKHLDHHLRQFSA